MSDHLATPVDSQPDLPSDDTSLVEKIERLLASDDVDGVVKRLHEREPKDNGRLPAALLMVIGKTLSKHARDEEFLAIIDPAVEQLEHHPKLASMIGLRLYKAARYEEAVRALGIAADRLPPSDEVFHKLTKCAQRAGDMQGARTAVDRWLQEMPASAKAAAQLRTIQAVKADFETPHREMIQDAPSNQLSPENVMLMSDGALQELYENGEVEAALAGIDARIRTAPRKFGLVRRKVKWLTELGDTERLWRALQHWAEADKSEGGLEALARLARLHGNGTSAKETAAALLLHARIEAAEERLLTQAPEFERRLKIHLLAENATGLKEALAGRDSKENAQLDVSTVVAILKFLKGDPQLDDLLDLDALDLQRFEAKPHQLLIVGMALVQAGRFASGREALAKASEQHPPSDKIFSARVQCAEALGLQAEAEDLVERWQAALPESVAAARRHLKEAKRAGDLERASRCAKRIVQLAGARAADWREVVQAVLATEGEAAALQLAARGLDRFPTDHALLAVAADVATRVAEHEAAADYLERERLVRELGHEICQAVGFRAITDAGSRHGIHQAIMDLTAETPSVSGLMDFARVCLESLKILLTRRSGEKREARELACYGAANWRALAPAAQRLHQLIRVLCAQAHQADNGNTGPLEILLELETLCPSSASVDTLLTCLAERPLQDKHLWDRLWYVALDRNDPQLIRKLTDRTSSAAARRARVHSIADLDEDATDVSVIRTNSEHEFTKTVAVASDSFNGSIDLQISSFADCLAGPICGTIHAGFFVERDDGTVISPPDSNYRLKGRDALLHAGKRSVLIDHEVREETFDRPLLYVAALPAHYSQYFHFFGQMLPRICAIKATLSGADVRLGIPDFAPPFVMELLAAVGIAADEVTFLPSDAKAHVPQLWTTNLTTYDWQCSPSHLASCRNEVRLHQCQLKRPRRLFLSRPLTSVKTVGRTLVNELQLASIAQERGFEVIDPASLNLQRQRELFSECDTICGPTGAALANLLFLPDDAHVICLSPHETCRTYYPGLTLGSATRFSWVLGNYLPEASSSQRFPHLPYVVPIEHLSRVL